MTVARRGTQQAIASGSSGDVSVSFPGAATAGDLVLVGAAQNESSTPTATAITDNQTNTYTRDSPGVSAINVGVAIYSAQNVAASGTFTVTFHPLNTGDSTDVAISEYSGVASSNALDVVANGTNPSAQATWTSGTTAATAQGDEVVFAISGGVIGMTSITGNSPFSDIGSHLTVQSFVFSDRITTTTGTQGASWAVVPNATWTAAIATYKGSTAHNYTREFGAAIKTNGQIRYMSPSLRLGVLQPEFKIKGLLALYEPQNKGSTLQASVEPGLGHPERTRSPSTSIIDGGWMNPDNAFATDSLYATQALRGGGGGFSGSWANFGFDNVLPANAEVTRVEVLVRIKADIEDPSAVAYVNVSTNVYFSGDIFATGATTTERTYAVDVTSALGLLPGTAAEFWDIFLQAGVTGTVGSNRVAWSLNSLAVRITWTADATIQYVAGSTATGTNAGTDIDVSLAVPSGVVAGDLMMVLQNGGTVTRPAGWSPIPGSGLGPNAGFYRLAQPGEPASYSWHVHSSPGPVFADFICDAFRGVHPTTPFETIYEGNGDTVSTVEWAPVTAPLITGTPGTMMLAQYINNSVNQTNCSTPAGYTARDSLVGNLSGMQSFTKLKVTPGNEAPTATDSTPVPDWSSAIVGLRPANMKDELTKQTVRPIPAIIAPYVSNVFIQGIAGFFLKTMRALPATFTPVASTFIKRTQRTFAATASFAGATLKRFPQNLAGVLRFDRGWSRVPGATLVNKAIGPANPWTAGSLGAAVSAGDKLIAVVILRKNTTPAPTATGITDSLGNVWVEDPGPVTLSADGFFKECSTWSTVSAAGTPSSIQLSWTGTADRTGIAVAAYSGLLGQTGAAGLDIAKVVASHAVSPADSGTTAGTTAVANELKIGYYAESGYGKTLTAGTLDTAYAMNVSNAANSDADLGIEDAVSGPAGSTARATMDLTPTTIADWFMGVNVYKLSDRSALVKQTRKALAATLALIGALTKQTNKALAGILSFLGSVATVYTPFAIVQNLFATLSFVGSQTKKTTHVVPATLSFIGTTTKLMSRALAATLSFIGTLTKQTNRPLAATLSFAGYMLRGRMMAATLSFAGAIAKQTSKPQAATLAFVGALPKQTRRLVSALLSLGTSGGPVVFDAKSNPAAGVSVSSMTFSHTTGGSNRYLFVPVFTGPPQTPSSVTYAGVAMTRLGGIDNGGGTAARQEMYGLVNPPLGANNVVVTLGSSVTNLLSAAVSFNGVNQTASVGAFVSGTTVTITITDSVAGDMVIDAAGSDNFSTVDSSQIEVWNIGSTWASAGSTKPGASGNVDMTWTSLTVPRHIGMAIKQGTGGGLFKRTSRLLAGILSFIGSLVTLKAFNRALVATLSFVGSQTKQTNKALAATLSLIGALTRFITLHAYAATLSFVGTLAKRTGRLLAAVLSFVGTLTLIKAFGVALAATLSFATAITRQTTHAMPATLSFIGTTTRAITLHAYTATLSFIGTFTKQTRRLLAATLSFVGTLTTIKALNQALFATLSFAGAITRKTTHAMPATLLFVGAIPARAIGALLTATLSFVGLLNKRVPRNLAATLSFIGTLAASHQFFRTLVATLLFVGGVTKQTGKLATGTLSFVGAITRRAGHLATATLALVGAIPARAITRALSATLAFAGTTFKRLAKIPFLATLSFVGTGIFIRVTLKVQALFATVAFSGGLGFGRQKLFVAILGFTGQTNRSIARILTGTLSFVGTLIRLLRYGRLIIGATSYRTYLQASTYETTVLVGKTGYRRVS